MKALKIIAVIVLGIIAIFLIMCAFLPKNVHTESSSVINAPARQVFAQVNSFKNWAKWSPFQTDTTMINQFEGPEYGVGAKIVWTSEYSGNGSQTITESVPDSFIKTDLDFMEQGSAFSIYTFEPYGDSTIMKWSTDMLDLGYPLGRFMGLFMNGMMQSYYKIGFDNLNKLLAGMPTIEVTFESVGARKALIIKDSAMMNDIGSKMGSLYGEIMGLLQKNSAEMSGPPFCIYYTWDVNKPFVMECGIPVAKVLKGSGRIEFREIPETKTAKTIHKGSYETSGITHDLMNKYLSFNNIEVIGYPWEVYVTDPMMEKDTTKWITEIYYPIK
jgi:effector-binding domain-containing protein